MNRRLVASLVFVIPALLATSTIATAQNSCGVQIPTGGAAITPSVVVCVNGIRFSVPGVAVDGKFGVLRPTTIAVGNGASFTVGASFNSDPYSNFSFSSSVPGGFGVFTFDAFFTTPVLSGSYNAATASYTSSLSETGTVGAGASSATISTGMYPSYLSGSTELGTLGVDVGTSSCSLSTPSTVACPPGNKSNTFSPISPASLTAHLSYSHSATGTTNTSTAIFDGGVQLTSATTTTTTPEPSTVLMLTAGMIVLLGATRRRRAVL